MRRARVVCKTRQHTTKEYRWLAKICRESTVCGFDSTESASMMVRLWLSMLKVYDGSHDNDTRRKRYLQCHA